MPRILEFFGLSNVFTSVKICLKTCWGSMVIVLIAIVIVSGAYLLTKSYAAHIISLVIGITLVYLAKIRLEKEIKNFLDNKESKGGK